MIPTLPLRLDHTCWRVVGADIMPDVHYYPNPILAQGPADLETEARCPACQWLAGYSAALRATQKGGM